MIILVTGWFQQYDNLGFPTGEKEFLTSHGIDLSTGQIVIVSHEHPSKLGAYFHEHLKEWVLE